MKVVSDNSPEDIARDRAERRISSALRALTANLIRVVRGAGKPGEISSQVLSLTEALSAYRDAAGFLPFGETLAEFIRPEDRDLSRWSDDEKARHWAQKLVIDGALQMTASRLLGQLTQESAGRSEMNMGIQEIEEIRAERRKQRELEERAYKAATRTKPAPRRKPTKP